MDKFGIIQRKILDLAALQRVIQSRRVTGDRIVFTNGCFDILHRGHVKLLMDAAAFGQMLVVGLNSDQSVRRLKGPGRPLISQEDRALMLASMEFVDQVIIFDQDNPGELVKSILPDVMVKGNDYTVDQIAGAQEVLASGGRVELVPLLEGFSTSAFLGRIRKT